MKNMKNTKVLLWGKKNEARKGTADFTDFTDQGFT